MFISSVRSLYVSYSSDFTVLVKIDEAIESLPLFILFGETSAELWPVLQLYLSSWRIQESLESVFIPDSVFWSLISFFTLVFIFVGLYTDLFLRIRTIVLFWSGCASLSWDSFLGCFRIDGRVVPVLLYGDSSAIQELSCAFCIG